MQGKALIIVREKYFRDAINALEKREESVIVRNIKRTEILKSEVNERWPN